jgi:PIN domain nuclease of toxin-antitoxin system
MSYLIDTHILLWWMSDKKRLSKEQRRVINRVSAENPLMLSDISLWEIATLVQLKKIQLSLPLRDWLEKATALPLIKRIPITPAIAAQVAVLPNSFHKDPADRIIVSSAIIFGAILVTSDKQIIRSNLLETVV